MNTIKLKCIKVYRHVDGRVWLKDEEYELTAREVQALKDELGNTFDQYFTE